MSPELTAGFPVHRVAVWAKRDNGVKEYRAVCGVEDYTTKAFGTVLGTASSARRAELCPKCWPNGRAR